MTNQSEISDIDKKILKMDDGEIGGEARPDADYWPEGNNLVQDSNRATGESGQNDEKRFLISEENPHLH